MQLARARLVVGRLLETSTMRSFPVSSICENGCFKINTSFAPFEASQTTVRKITSLTMLPR